MLRESSPNFAQPKKQFPGSSRKDFLPGNQFPEQLRSVEEPMLQMGAGPPPMP